MRLPFARRRPGRRPIKDQVVEARQFSARALTAFVIVSSALLLLVARFVYLQVIAHEDFVTRSVNNQVKVLPVPPNRGLIYDRRGRPIAENRPAYRLEIVPEKIDDLEQVIGELGRIVELSNADQLYQNPRHPYTEVLLNAVPVPEPGPFPCLSPSASFGA